MSLSVTTQQASANEQNAQLVADLAREETRETALLELSKQREAFPDLAPILWHSFGTTATLLQEIFSIYSLLSPPQLTASASNRFPPRLPPARPPPAPDSEYVWH